MLWYPLRPDQAIAAGQADVERWINTALALLGPLLGGRDGEGLVGVTFAVQGSLDKPEFKINPLSALVPGVFRELFEFRAKELPQAQ